MGNKTSRTRQERSLDQGEINPVQRKKNDRGSVECEVLGFGPEALESAAAWEYCRKNPQHSTFLSQNLTSSTCLKNTGKPQF
ncbi:hypothetical protein RRG08_058859 [Elysia crispata]|uniref:Uncharacterized protein n=1 Tax=Elysia crispata TaxID=231223 RepID=A0AAE1CQ51_9GAST|nr:hypothetical protein RRG08_058859 [Elysia crispata]